MKTLLIDLTALWNGSANMTKNAMRNNEEAMTRDIRWSSICDHARHFIRVWGESLCFDLEEDLAQMNEAAKQRLFKQGDEKSKVVPKRTRSTSRRTYIPAGPEDAIYREPTPKDLGRIASELRGKES